MRNILKKELKLSSSPLSFLFIVFGLMFLLPGYPVLCGAFFVTLGIFQSFQNVRETNDILFSALLPIPKKDVVKGKFIFVCFTELCSAALMGICTVMRMTVFSQVPAYRNNALMNANLFALGMSFVIFAIFNSVFVGGFFKTAYKIGKPFVLHIVLTIIVIGICETLHHFPGLENLNAFGGDHIILQIVLLAAGILTYISVTFLSLKISFRRFERIDL